MYILISSCIVYIYLVVCFSLFNYTIFILSKILRLQDVTRTIETIRLIFNICWTFICHTNRDCNNHYRYQYKYNKYTHKYFPIFLDKLRGLILLSLNVICFQIVVLNCSLSSWLANKLTTCIWCFKVLIHLSFSFYFFFKLHIRVVFWSLIFLMRKFLY